MFYSLTSLSIDDGLFPNNTTKPEPGRTDIN